jgi:hypothetical protein
MNIFVSLLNRKDVEGLAHRALRHPFFMLKSIVKAVFTPAKQKTFCVTKA